MSYIREMKEKQPDNSFVHDETSKKDKQPSFFIHPQRRTRQTFIKAPMAHKTFSQEQFQSKFYTLSISFENTFKDRSVLMGLTTPCF